MYQSVKRGRLSAGAVRVCMLGAVAGLGMVLFGCGQMRYGVTAAQKQNAWLHARVCAAAKAQAAEEGATPRLCGLTQLSAQQCEAFVLDYGLPEEVTGGPGGQDDAALPDEALDALLRDGAAVAETARAEAARRPDAWALADGALELGIALAGLLGGVYGARAAGFLQQAREKSKAIREIVAGNELFKQLYPEQAERFKEAQAKQSAVTRRIVTELK